MKKFLLSALILLLISVFNNRSSAQPILVEKVVPNLSQTEPATNNLVIPYEKWKLPNGLTYFIRANKKPENRAQFHLVVNAGFIFELEKILGLAHFLEHITFNSTKNLHKIKIVNFLERTGMQFGADLNAYTSFDETAYRLEVPMDKPEVVKQLVSIVRAFKKG